MQGTGSRPQEAWELCGGDSGILRGVVRTSVRGSLGNFADGANVTMQKGFCGGEI